uniref:Uncharacterized protein n=1 Tax=Rhizophora mucronata TaxID=61149 RepID=A0A2P2QER3_RHIMU
MTGIHFFTTNKIWKHLRM